MLPEFCYEPWRPVRRWEAVPWGIFYLLFLAYAAMYSGEFLFIDNANLIVHEGGHMLFGWFGATLGLWGGTLLQWLVPALLAGYFFIQRHTTGFVFCAFMLFENFLYTATYIADARAQVLPLVSVGDTGDNPHDWFNILSSMGLLEHDTQIAAFVRFAGWVGMLSMIGWFAWRGYAATVEER